ncbi:MAG: sugar transferase [Chlamydiales bacterium]
MSKRIFDILFSLGATLFFFPLGVIIGFLIMMTSPGPIFYSCQRVGKDGQPIRCRKFRTMHFNADLTLEQILDKSPILRQEWETYRKLKNDPRITSIGKFLRKTSLDELPQLFDVFLGQLSIVGPRPITQKEVNKYYKEKAEKILSMKPGLTGLWQTSGRNKLIFHQRVLLEESYIEKSSFVFDLKIIFKTIYQMLFLQNGY